MLSSYLDQYNQISNFNGASNKTVSLLIRISRIKVPKILSTAKGSLEKEICQNYIKMHLVNAVNQVTNKLMNWLMCYLKDD